jgi:hypothetical protein
LQKGKKPSEELLYYFLRVITESYFILGCVDTLVRSETLSAVVQERATRLSLVAHAAANVFGGKNVTMTEPEDLYAALQEIRTAVLAVPGAYLVIVGGLAVQEHGYARWTEDVDAVVDSEHFSSVLEQLRQAGFEITDQYHLKHRVTGVQLDLLRAGVKLSGARATIPEPQELGENLGFASLNGLIRLKLIANRIVDLADVSRLLQAHPTPEEWAHIREKLPSEFHGDFDRIALDAGR